MTTAEPSTTPKPRRRWLQFSRRPAAYADFEPRVRLRDTLSRMLPTLPRGTMGRVAGQVRPGNHRRRRLVMTIDREARTVLRNALVSYMSGAIRTFAFEDQYSPCGKSGDESVQVIVRQVWYMHDGLIDHPISVTQGGWESLRRTVAFLGTHLEIAPPGCGSWPFRDEADWRLHEHLVNELGLPDYDPDVQGRPANPWWNRIPTSVGVLILVTILAAVFLMIAFS